MKKVGILTLPLNDNYGGTIQKIALYHFLEKEGHQPYLIDKMYNQSRLKVLIKQMMTHNPFYKLFDYNNLTRRRKSLKKINAFVDSYFKQRTKRVFDERRLKQVCRGFDAIIVGSDQVWRYKYVKENYSHYFLNFAFPNQKKLSYAASFGIDFWEGNEDSIEKISLFLADVSCLYLSPKDWKPLSQFFLCYWMHRAHN